MTKTLSHYLLAFVLIFACLVPVSGKVTLAAHSQSKTAAVAEAPSPLNDASVNLYCRLTAGRKVFSSSGGGVIIDPRGVILTNAHVVQYFLLSGESGRSKGTGRLKGSCTVKTGSPAKAAYTASLLYIPPAWLEAQTSKKTANGASGENDFALLFIDGGAKGKSLPAQFPSLPVDTSGILAEGDAVTLRGYPSGNLTFSQINAKLKALTATSTITNIQSFNGLSPDVLTIAPSAAGSPGISGSPVLNNKNSVIGIATAKSIAKNDRTLRAITLQYINRILQTQTLLPLNTFLLGDLKAQAVATNAAITAAAVKTIENSLLKIK